MVVIAGAGAGKTHTIIGRVEKLIENKVCKPEQIVMMTFTRHAANVMKMRIQKHLRNRIFIGTIDAILRRYIVEINPQLLM